MLWCDLRSNYSSVGKLSKISYVTKKEKKCKNKILVDGTSSSEWDLKLTDFEHHCPHKHYFEQWTLFQNISDQIMQPERNWEISLKVTTYLHNMHILIQGHITL